MLSLSLAGAVVRRNLQSASLAVLSLALLAPATASAQGDPSLLIPNTTGLQLKNEDMSTAALNKAQATGARLVRKAIYWDTIETSPGVFNWSQLDAWVNSMESRGFGMLITLVWNNRDYENIWDRAIVTEPGRQAFANFVALVAARYAGKNIIFEIWNEPNLRSFWHENPEGVSNTDAMAEEYTELVKDAAPAMKAADPNCRIAAGSISALWSASFSWFERCVEVGILDSGIDCISVHPYGFRWPELAYRDGYPVIRQIMDANGGDDMPIITSEVGYDEGWLIERGFTATNVEQAQAWMFVRQNLVDAMAGLHGTIWYDLTDPVWGVLETNLTERQTFFAAQVFTAQLNGYYFVQRVTLPSELDFAAIFQNALGQRKLVAWTTPNPSLPLNQRVEAAHSVTLPVGAGGSYAVVDTFGNVTNVTATGTNLNVTIGGGPIYVPLKAVEYIIDNTDASRTTAVGAWTASSSEPGYYGANYLHDGNTGKGTKTFQFNGTAPVAGNYAVYMRWSAAAGRASNAPVTITTSSGASNKTVNQRTGGGAWNLLGTYAASANTPITVKLATTATNGHVIADAVRIVNIDYTPPPQVTEVIVDNTQTANVTITGNWPVSTSTSGYWGANYLHDDNTGKGSKSVQLRAAVPTAGSYHVFLRWTSGTGRASNVPVSISTSAGAQSVNVDQRTNGGQWVLLGTYTANANTNVSVTLSNTGTSGHVIADAIRVLKAY